MSDNNPINNQTKKPALWLGWLICGVGALFYCYEYLLRIEPSVMVPQLMRHFNIHAAEFGMVISLYYTIYTPMQLIVGTMTDLYGARRILTGALSICVIGSLVFSISHSLHVAAVGRLLIGFGSAFAFVGVLKLASIWLPTRHFGFAAGLTTGLGMLGAMVGNIGMARLVGGLGYEHTLLIGTVTGAILLPLTFFIIRDNPNEATFTHEIEKYKDTFKSVWEIVKNPQMWLCGFIGSVMYLSLSVFAELWGNPYLQQVHGFSNDEASSLIAVVFFGWLIGGPVSGWLSDRLQNRKIILLCGAFFSSLIFAFILFVPSHNTILLAIALGLFGIFSSAEILCFAVGRELSPNHLAGSAVAFINMLVMVGGLIFQPVVGWLLDLNWAGVYVNQVRHYPPFAFKIALMFIPIACLLATLAGIWLKESYASQ